MFNIVEKKKIFMSVSALVIVAGLIAFFAMGVNVLSTYYFQSLMKGGYSLAVSTLRNIIISSVLLITLPMFFGGFAIWFAIPITEAVVAVISFILLITNNKQMKSKV